MAKKIFSNEEVAKKYDSLPEEVKNLLYGFEMTSIITKVGEKHGLHIDQMDKLNTETGYVMMGLTDTKDFPAVIAEDLGIEPAKAQGVARDIEGMLFSKIRDAMKAFVAPPSPVINSSASKAPLSTVLPTSSTTPATSPTPSVAQVPAAPAPTALEIPPKIEPVEKKVEPKVEVKPSDIILTQPTVAKTPDIAIKTQAPASTTPGTPPTTKPEPPKPQDYKADPYREPTV
jgi:hypothetical protein